MKCGKPIRDGQQEYCHDCMNIQHDYDKGVALWVHKPPVNLSIYQFKFHNQRSFGSCYAREIMSEYGDVLAGWEIDMVIPVPLHPAKYRKRGYNQAAVLAKELGRILGIPVEESLLLRIQKTDPQKKLAPGKRRQNLAGAFVVKDKMRKLAQGSRILIVDDIYTTGSTVDEAAKALKKAGAEKVFYLTISIGQGN